MLFDFASFIPRYFHLNFRCHVPECAIAHKNPPHVSVVGYKTLVQNPRTEGGYRRGVQEGGTGGGYRTREQEASTARFSAVCALVRCISALADVGVAAALGYWAVGFKSRLGRSELGKRAKGGSEDREDRLGEHDVSDRSAQVVHSDLPWSGNRVVLDSGLTVSTAREDRRKKGG